EKAQAADIDGVIVVDYPPEECVEFSALAKKNGIDPVFLLAPTSTEKRIEEVARIGSGYLYYVSLRGVTGASHIDLSDVAARIPKIRAATRLPIGVGLGTRKTVPEGLWTKCAACDAVLYSTDLEKNLNVCPKCGHHERLGARPRLDALLDADGRFEIGAEVLPVDTLKFKDSRRYTER